MSAKRMRYSMLAASISCIAIAANTAGDLEARVAGYLKVRQEATRGLGTLKAKAEPEEIERHKVASANAIRVARVGAKQGDILTPTVEDELRALLRSEMKGKAGRPVKETAKDGNPITEPSSKQVTVEVNAPYPDGAPLSTVPPSILLRLPKLPEVVEFRFVGRHLILLDTGAGLILDYISNAIPK